MAENCDPFSRTQKWIGTSNNNICSKDDPTLCWASQSKKPLKLANVPKKVKYQSFFEFFVEGSFVVQKGGKVLNYIYKQNNFVMGEKVEINFGNRFEL